MPFRLHTRVVGGERELLCIVQIGQRAEESFHVPRNVNTETMSGPVPSDVTKRRPTVEGDASV